MLRHVEVVDSNLNLGHGRGSSCTGWPEWCPLGVEWWSSGAEVHLRPADCSLSDPQQTEGFRKRWFTMDDRRLMYFKDPLVRKVRL